MTGDGMEEREHEKMLYQDDEAPEVLQEADTGGFWKKYGGVIKGSSGPVIHGTLCPYHGLLGVAVKAGLAPAAILGPVYAVHDFVVHDVAEPIVSYFVDDPETAHEIAHYGVDYASLALAIATPTYFISRYIMNRKRDADK